MTAPGIASLTERVYVSQFGSPVFGLNIYQDAQPVDPDGDVTVTVTDESDDSEVAVLIADRNQVGEYQVSLTSVHTQKPGYYTLEWSYTLDATPEVFESYIEVGQAAPAYDDLDEDMKDLVDMVWLKFADLYDSPEGGPHAQVHLQTHFGRGRVAQLMRTAIGRLNSVAQPRNAYTVSSLEGSKFPLGKWGGVLEMATYIEVVKHLIRIYTEQPEAVGVNVARMDRRDYVSRWRDILRDEQADFEDMRDHFKIAHMGLGRPGILVSGGVYGELAPTRVGHAAAARPRYWARWY